jgi:chemotaxis protein methyltransferase CheR
MSLLAALRRRDRRIPDEPLAIAPEPIPAGDPLSRAVGIDLTAFRSDHVEECVRRALEREDAADPQDLAAQLVRNPEARTRFRRSVAVSLTGMFRDPHQFDELAAHIPRVRASAPKGVLRVWSAGCADGSELASAAVLLERSGALGSAQLLGSDLLEENVDEARRRAPQLQFEVRDVVADDPPPGHWSIVLCRNLAIYLAPEAKARLHGRLASALAVGGLLVLGRSERLVRPEELGLARMGAHMYARLG